MPAPSASRVSALCLLLIIGAYIAVGAQYAALTPPWQVPDEPAHYNYVRQVAATGTLPVLQPGDYDQAYLSQLTAEGFPPDMPVDSLRYEGHQPPLYYLLAAPAYLAASGALLPLRLFSLALGGGVILFAYLIVRGLFPARPPALALTAAGLVAFLPQHVAMMAGVNNDSLAELAIAATLWAALRGPGTGKEGARPGLLRLEPWIVAVGCLAGAAFLTKTTAYVAAPAATLAVWLRARREGWPGGRQARAAAALLIPAAALGALWWGRNLAVYGWPDLLGLERHDAIIAGQPRTAEWIAAYGWAGYLRLFAVTTFNSFWGQFGWMGVPMDRSVYVILFAVSLFVLAGCALALGRRAEWTPAGRDGMIALTLSAALTAGLYLYYNVALVQHQGRYLFPALIPLAAWAALGLNEWADIVGRRGSNWLVVIGGQSAVTSRQASVIRWLPLGAVSLLAALDLVALYRFLLPALPRF